MEALSDPEKRWADLPPETRKFIEDLRPEDIGHLRDGLKTVREIKTISKFAKWFTIMLIGTFIATVGFAENVMKVIGWFRGTGK